MEMRAAPSRSLDEAGAGRAPGGANRPDHLRGEAPADAAGRLTDALKKGKGGSGGQLGDPANAGPSQDSLASLFSQAMTGLPGQAPAGEREQPLAAPMAAAGRESTAAAERCGELVERIMASPPSADGSAEVRIKIDKPWLPDTEVRLTLSPDARLEVEFRADSLEAQRFLLPNLGQLRERLTERCDGGAVVRMTEGSREGGGDGRSRNRRSVIEELGGEKSA